MDLNLLKIDTILQFLPEAYELETRGRLKGKGSADPDMIHIQAVRVQNDADDSGRMRGPRPKHIDLWADEDTGFLRKMEMRFESPRRWGRAGTVKWRWGFEFVRTVDLPDSFYRGE